MPVNGSVDVSAKSNRKPLSLSFWAAKALIGSKKNFFTDSDVAPVLKDYICDVYERFNVCQNCPRACLNSSAGRSTNL